MIIETNANFCPHTWLKEYTRNLQTFTNCSIGLNLKKAEKIQSETISKAVIFNIHLSQN